jgi:L-threonylcarbamoyladenylate synthase
MGMVTADEFKLKKEKFLKKIEGGEVFIHPTDTIYGIGCDATNDEAVERVRKIKQREEMPFSVIAPSKKWIYDNCDVKSNAFKWIEKLPGPYTLIFKLINKEAVSKHVNCGWGTIGVRIPKHWFSEVIAELGFPVVSTSANIAGEAFMTSIDDLDSKIRVDFIIYEGEKKGKPSTIINLVEEKEEIIER